MRYLGVIFLLLVNGLSSQYAPWIREAKYYKKLDDNYVQCLLCPRKCMLPPGATGFCRNRKNIDGKLYTLVYGRLCSVNIDIIEKAPFYHVLPGSKRLACAAVSCNLRCKYCQNWHISQVGPGEVPEYYIPPEELVKIAKKYGLKIICFTYTEPTVCYEYMLDVFKIAKKEGLITTIVSNGYINPEPLKELLKYTDAIKIDLKGFTEDFYREVSMGDLKSVLRTLKIIKKSGVWLEIVNLVVPTLNDNPEDIRRMCEWIRDSLGPDVPVHFTRFHPDYKLTNLPATPIKTLERAVKIAKEVGLHYVYIGNVPGHPYNNTYCPYCGKLLIRRVGLTVLENHIKDGKCPYCGHKIPGLWSF